MFAYQPNPSGAPPFEGSQLKGTTNTQQLNDSSSPFEPGTTATSSASSRKRGRDIHSLERFKQVVFGERGFPRLHKMVARNPILMYPPLDMEMTHQSSSEVKNVGKETGEGDSDHEPKEALRSYHHKQLDVFLHLLYEFNHTSFVKLPMNDTLQLLSRCGREAVAHVTEYEMHQRMKHSARLRELRASHEEKHRLRTQFMELEELQAQAELDRAEAEQRELDLMDLDHMDGSDGQSLCITPFRMNGLQKKDTGSINISPSVDTAVGTGQEIDALNAASPALGGNEGDGRAQYDSVDLEIEPKPHPANEATF